MISYLNTSIRLTVPGKRNFSVASSLQKNEMCKLLVVGGGTAGCAVSAKFARKLGRGDVVVIEPSQYHYYQPMWTMVGGGMKSESQSRRPMKQVLSSKVRWVQDRVTRFEPGENKVVTEGGVECSYEYLVIALGIVINWSAIKNLDEALKSPGVSTNYLPKSSEKTFENMKQLTKGTAVFTFPNGPIKCPGAPQKIAYITDDYLRKKGCRNDVNIVYNTALPVIFGVEKYAKALWKVTEQRNIMVNTRRNLVEIRPDRRQAIFEDLDGDNKQYTQEYDMLHVAPPMRTPDELASCGDLVDGAGYVDVDKSTLQHVRYPNVFAIGDCSNLPTSKTAAAVAGECGVLEKNLWAVMNNQSPAAVYDGYTSCPLITSYSKAILAEFRYGAQPLETLPIEQDREMRLSFILKKDLMPILYWNLHLRGYWNGPGFVRKLLHLGMSE